MTRDQALETLQTRKVAVAKELKRLCDIQFDQQPLPGYIDAMFDFSISQFKAESNWINNTLDYMQTKPWTT